MSPPPPSVCQRVGEQVLLPPSISSPGICLSSLLHLILFVQSNLACLQCHSSNRLEARRDSDVVFACWSYAREGKKKKDGMTFKSLIVRCFCLHATLTCNHIHSCSWQKKIQIHHNPFIVISCVGQPQRIHETK